eukprot:CAMPEP_0185040924 /NCGR_PEP_ID=MMETSP1103-20130426/39591_1 /TAXON_ID=36769 /ORGANISM="Paraphysomonas bandaiensis, Strain Caron Lab Isolate" /LENGTH=910 /DNA_ID=CAMNT_0027580445 /DNA_START=23 /DNA_END=2752 /DNA_ORIENTATION=+
MNSFNLPAGYEDFVSSAESLLSQFKEANSVDIMVFKIYSDSGYTIDQAIAQQQAATEYISKLTDGYIWQRDSIRIKVILPQHGPVYLGSVVEFGDNIEDEWFVVHVLFQLSKQFPSMNITVSDSDGQFLLIEAASHIPEWLSPDNSENRVWIRNGSLYIIPLDEVGRTRDGTITLQSALEVLCKRGESCIASKSVHQCLSARTDVYPAQARANLHTAVCVLPRTVAELLRKCPQYISVAVNGLCSERDKFYTRSMSAMSKFGVQDYVIVPVQFTRALYAQLTFQARFHPPPRFHSIQRKLQLTKWDSATAKAFDLGCRVTCGLEIAYQKSVKRSASAVQAREERRVSTERFLDQHISKCEANSVSDKPDIDNFVVLTTDLTSDIIADNEDAFILDAFQNPMLLHEHITSLQNELNDVTLCEVSPQDSESDGWLHMTPEEFEKNMNERVSRIAGENDVENDKSNMASTKEDEAPVGGKRTHTTRYDMPRASSRLPRSVSAAGTDNDSDDDTMVTEIWKQRPVNNQNLPEEATAASNTSTNSSEEPSRILSDIVGGMNRFISSYSDVGGFADETQGKGSEDEELEADVDDTRDDVRVASGGTDISEPSGSSLDENALEEISFDSSVLISILEKGELSPRSAMKKVNENGGDNAVSGSLRSEDTRRVYFNGEDETRRDIDDDVQVATDGVERLCVSGIVGVNDILLENDINDGDNGDDDGDDSDDEVENNIEATKNIHDKESRSSVGRSPTKYSLEPSKVSVLNFDTSTSTLTGVAFAHTPPKEGNFPSSDEDDGSSDESEGEDSDDWTAGGEEKENSEDRFMSEYMDAMEAELSGSTMLETFERYSADVDAENGEDGLYRPVDIEANLLKNLLESHASQMGSAGPASNLLSQLGIDLPPPPSLVDTNSDDDV